MLDSKFFFTLVGLIVAVFAMCNSNFASPVKEGWWNSSAPRTIYAQREVGGKNPYAIQNNWQAMVGSDKFVSYPSMQGMLSPRFGNYQVGANIRYNPPSYENMSTPCNPLDFGNMAKNDYKENYGCVSGECDTGCKGGFGMAQCGKGGVSLGNNSNGGNISMDPAYLKATSGEMPTLDTTGTDVLAVGDMTTIGADGALKQPIIMDRYMFANLKSNLYAQADPIRGDLAIVPCNTGWFNVSVNPNVDLNPGAMNVMGGVNNDTSKALAELQFATSGGTNQIHAGVDMSNQFKTQLGSGIADINVSTFA
jgi:hypothetical protein